MSIQVAALAAPLHPQYQSNMSTTFALTNISNEPQDIYFVNGQLAFVTGKQYTAQRIKTRLQLFLGEWAFDTSQGVPWFEEVFIEPANIITVEAIIKNTILNTPNVTGLTSYTDSLNRITRNYSVQFVATSVDGDISDTVDISALLSGAKNE